MESGCTTPKAAKKRSIPLPVLPVPAGGAGEIRHSRTSIWRAGALGALTLLMVVHFIQWKISGSTISPIEPSETMATLQRGAVNAGFIFFTLAIIATLVFGRFVCGWGCHILALQDFCAWLLNKARLKPRPFRSRLLMFVPILAALYMFAWPTVSRYLYAPKNEPLVPQFTNHIITTEFWATFPPIAVAIPFLFICGFVIVYFLGSKGFCTYACPYGGIFSLSDRFAPGKIRVTDACNQCGHCTAVCTSNVLVHAEVKEYGMVVDTGCMKCMDCVSVCPNDALYFGFGMPSIVSGGGKSLSGDKPVTKSFSLTWPEEVAAAVIFFVSLIAVWDVYQLVPMLMGLGIAAITAFLALRTWKLVRSKDLSFYRYNLKHAGRMRSAGWVFLAVSVLWIALNAHSGWVRYHESAGARAFEAVGIPDELALAQANPDQWLSAAEKQNIAQGKADLLAAANGGLFVNKEALPKLAWLEYLSGDSEQAIKRLAAAADSQDGQGKALSLYYRGAILNRLGRYDQAITSLDQSLAASPDLILAREEKGESLWQLGRKDEAISAWNDAVKRNPGLVLANYMIAGAADSIGKTDAAAAYEQQAARGTPNDPYFHWMIAMRLKNVGMDGLAEKHFQQAIQLDPRFRTRKR